jgi:hypothetical protein
MFVIAGTGLTVNARPLLVSPLVVTTTFPVVAVVGIVATTEVPETLDTVAETPLTVTVESAPKLRPLIATVPPGGPALGKSAEIVGGWITVKFSALLKTPLAYTVAPPVVAPVGTVVVILVGLQVVMAADAPLNCTVPWAAPKLLPEMVTAVPTCPEDGLIEATLGAGTTVNVRPLLALPAPEVTTTLPVAAPDGTAHTMRVSDHGQSEATTPLKVTFPVPCVDPKLLPFMVTEAPTAPALGDRPLMLGITTVKSTPLLSTPLA